jgi:hypothetical protein
MPRLLQVRRPTYSQTVNPIDIINDNYGKDANRNDVFPATQQIPCPSNHPQFDHTPDGGALFRHLLRRRISPKHRSVGFPSATQTAGAEIVLIYR